MIFDVKAITRGDRENDVTIGQVTINEQVDEEAEKEEAVRVADLAYGNHGYSYVEKRETY